LRSGVAQSLRRLAHELAEQIPIGLRQQGGSAGSVTVPEGVGVMALGVGPDPVTDDPRGDPQATGNRGDRLTPSDFEDGQRAAVHAGVVGGTELLLQTPPLPGSQYQGAHAGSPALQERLSRGPPCEKTSADLLSLLVAINLVE
jgi:hypothetical protein